MSVGTKRTPAYMVRSYRVVSEVSNQCAAEGKGHTARPNFDDTPADFAAHLSGRV